MRSLYVPHSVTSFVVWACGFVVLGAVATMLYDGLVVGGVTLRSSFALAGALLWLVIMFVVALVQLVAFRLRKPPQPVQWWALGTPVLAAAVLIVALRVLMWIGPDRY